MLNRAHRQGSVEVPFIVWERHSKLLCGDSESKLASVEKSSKTTLDATWLCHSGKMSGTPVLSRAVTTTPMAAVKKKATVVLSHALKTKCRSYLRLKNALL